MYEDYSFCLYWEDLDKELKQTKIDMYIEYHKRESKEEISEEDAEMEIESHFPIYF